MPANGKVPRLARSIGRFVACDFTDASCVVEDAERRDPASKALGIGGMSVETEPSKLSMHSLQPTRLPNLTTATARGSKGKQQCGVSVN